MIPEGADPRPFIAVARAALVLPTLPADHPDRASLDYLTTLILRELPEMEAELGCTVIPTTADALPGDLPAMLIGPPAMNPALERWREAQEPVMLPDGPFVAIDRDGQRVVADAPDLAGVGDAMQLLRTAIAEGRDLLEPSLCDSPDAMLDRLDIEVRRTFPLLTDRALGWAEAVERARREMRDADDLATLQRLMATLDDAHTWAKDPRVNGRLPYHLHDGGTTTRFWDVPEGTAAWENGLRPGDTVRRPDTRPWWPRTSSVAHTKAWNVGYRAMQGTVGEQVKVVAARDDGSEVSWTEEVPPLPWPESVEAGRLDSQTGYLRIRGWLNGEPWRDVLEDGLGEMWRYDRLVVDLRGNVGGALIAAQDARARFLSERTVLGSIRFSAVTGRLDPPHELIAEPAASGPRWVKPVRFLVDPLCYSATEDFLLGLQGLPHVQLVGQATGGGSGRPRTIRLRERILATISTAPTYDRTGRCVEGNGFAPDIAIPADPRHPDTALKYVLRDW